MNIFFSLEHISLISRRRNPNRRYTQNCMDGQWNFRDAYKAKKVKDDQDAFCKKVEAEDWSSLVGDESHFPESLEWESLVDVLSGRVKVSPAFMGFLTY